MNIHEMQIKKRDLEATIQALLDSFMKLTGVTVTGVKPIVEDYHGDIFCRDVEVEVKL